MIRTLINAAKFPIKLPLFWFDEAHYRLTLPGRIKNAGPDTRPILEDLFRLGYHKVEGHYSPSQVAEFTALLKERMQAPGLDLMKRPGAVRWRQTQKTVPELMATYGMDPLIQKVKNQYYGKNHGQHQIMYQETWADDSVGKLQGEGQFVGLGREGYHLDGVGMRLKTILLLTDVTEESGPFTIVPGTHRFQWNAVSAARNGKILADMIAYKPFQLYFKQNETERLGLDKRSVSITGKAGDLLFADTSALHKAAILKKGERRVLWNYFDGY